MDIHSFPPSSSTLVGLSSLAPPSPILSALGVSCSSDHIPIFLDFVLEPTLSISSPSLPCAETQPNVACRASVGTFGPLNRESRSSDAYWSPNTPAFPGHSDPSWPVLPTSTLGPSPTLQCTSGTHISPSPSVASCPSSPRLRRKFKFPIDCNDPTLPASESRVPADENSAPAPRTKLVVPHSKDILRQQPPDKCEHPEIPLPLNLLWLRDTVIELLVDQEGFRAIHPTFKLVGFPKQTRGWDSPDGGLALFCPVKRETFRFHYAPLDGLPILRRLTINDDESRDYISRQASLSLKANGVYTVQGSESSHLPSGDSKIRWKFDYLVGDRLEQSGKIVDGEKTLTPLTFLCSPWLLHPSQARKMKFMHIVKKSVTTKLVAEKLQPPTLAVPPTKPAVPHLWTLHRRVQSSHADEPKSRKKTGSVRRAGEKSDGRMRRDENQETQFVGRRRRASSAGEGRRPVFSGCYPDTANLVAKHIVPRAELAELLNMSIEVGTRHDLGGLSPAPRQRRP
ncbi:hypothetical protein B0H11DRAFT_2087002 [Mycena galericulata]|nr:hypothetical protein B0H11DRAFT_2087002 [Mycena galericulata]